MRWIQSLTSLLLLIGAFEARSDEQPRTLEQRAQEMTDSLAKHLGSTAESIDLLIAGKKYTTKANSSSASLTQLFNHAENGVFKKSTDFSLNLKLPNVERRWQLRFTSYNEEEENRDLTQQRVRTRPRERDYGTALLFFQKLGKVRTMFQPRLLLKDPLEMSYLLRFESDAKVRAIKINPRVDLYADPVKGTGEYASLEFNMDLNKRLNLSNQNTEEYREHDNYFSTQHGISLDYSLKEDEALGCSVTAGSNNNGHFHLDSLTVATAFSHQFSPDRFNVSLSPYIGFGKSVHFKGNVGVSLSFLLTL